MEIEETVRTIIVEQLGVKPEEVVLDADLVDDLGADSLDTVELVMAFEEKFNFEIPDEVAERLRKVSDIIEYLTKRIQKEKGLGGNP